MSKSLKTYENILTFNTEGQKASYDVLNNMWTTSLGRLDMRSGVGDVIFNFRSSTSSLSFTVLDRRAKLGQIQYAVMLGICMLIKFLSCGTVF